MKKYKPILLGPLYVSLVLSFLPTMAQTGSIEGYISQNDSLAALSGVNIYLESTSVGTLTNGKGYFILSEVPEGTYTLVLSIIGFQRQQHTVQVVANETYRVTLRMKEEIASLDEVVVMTKGYAGLRYIPGSVHYIAAKELQQNNHTDINRALRAVPGINIQEEDGFGLRPNIGMRGSGVERSSKITVMEDGILIAPAPYSAPAAYYFPTLGRMQAIEIMKGSSQIQYGPYTTGGAINLISTQIPESFSGRIHLSGGSFRGRNLRATVGNKHRNVAYLVESFQYGSDGFKQIDGGGNSGFDKQDYMAKIEVNTGEKARIYQTVMLKAGRVTETSNETYLGLTDEDFRITPLRRYAASQLDVMKTTQSQLSLTHRARFTKNLHVTNTIYHTSFSRNWYKLDKVTDSTGAKTGISDLLDDPDKYQNAFAILTGVDGTKSNDLSVKANNRNYYAKGVQTVWGLNYITGRLIHQISMGMRLHFDQMDRFQWEDEYAMRGGKMALTSAGKPGTESNRLAESLAAAGFIQYRVKYNKLTMIPGVRIEDIQMSQIDYGKTDPDRNGQATKEAINNVRVYLPGVGINYQAGHFLNAFAGIHKGFSPPGPQEGALPEESINLEIGSRYQRQALSGQLVIFMNNYRNLLGADLSAVGGTGTGDLFNGGKARTQGIEAQLSYDLLSFRGQSPINLPLSLMYTLTDARFKSGFISTFSEWGTVNVNDQTPYIPSSQVAVIVGLDHKMVSLNLSGKYTGDMRIVPGQGAMAGEEKTNAYTFLDASLNIHLRQNLSFCVNVTNLTNASYAVSRRPAGLRPGMPRAFFAGLKASF